MIKNRELAGQEGNRKDFLAVIKTRPLKCRTFLQKKKKKEPGEYEPFSE